MNAIPVTFSNMGSGRIDPWVFSNSIKRLFQRLMVFLRLQWSENFKAIQVYLNKVFFSLAGQRVFHYSPSLERFLASSSISAIVFVEIPLSSPLMSSFRSQTRSSSSSLCLRIKSLINSLLLAYSFPWIFSFIHRSFGSFTVIVCLAIFVRLWCNNTPLKLK